MEAIILAGGLGTRLQSVIGQAPKCMAEVNGQPFLAYVLHYLHNQGCTRAILSLGYRHEAVLSWLSQNPFPFRIDYVIENEPLGTGGGILLALKEASAEHVVVLNGDTLFAVVLTDLLQYHLDSNAAVTLALKQMRDFDRYGVVATDAKGVVTTFEEKRYRESGAINGGVYVVSKNAVVSKNLPEKCSFEKDYLEAFVHEKNFYGLHSDGYFIDIGIPADYARAQQELKDLQL